MKHYLLLALTIIFTGYSYAQTEVAGAKIPNYENFGELRLQLNGAGVRSKLWINMYVAALYLEDESQDARAIMAADEPMAVKLHIVSKLITSSRMMDAVTDGFEKSLDGNTAPVQERIDRILDFFQEDITKDDVFDLVYRPGVGTTAYKNGEERGTIEGLDFKSALFGIWLSDNPASNDLKDDMLGK